MVKISTSILNKHDKDTILKLNQSNTDYLHIDIMDGIFVPHTSFKIEEVIELSKIANKKLDIHLMVINVESYLPLLSLNNLEYLTFHYEVSEYLNIIDEIKKYGIKCGLSVKPNTDIKSIFYLLDKIDLVLIMGVEPGMGGQLFIDDTLMKIKLLKQEIIKRNLKTLISVDGGINALTAPLCIAKGADILVAGTFITESNDLNKNIDLLKAI